MRHPLAALDVGTTAEALALAGPHRGSVAGFKIGHRLFTSAADALAAGADFPVVGRPMTAALDPRAAAARIAAGRRASIL